MEIEPGRSKALMYIIDKLYNNDFFGRIFHTMQYCLKSELSNCTRVLDIGCGHSSPIKYCENIKYSVGVEPWKPYLKRSQEQEIHTEYQNKKIEALNFEENSFDAVVLIEVIEHMSEELVSQIIEKSKKWAKKKIIITTPNGFVDQPEVDKNPFQKHLSGWDHKKMKDLGFKVKGLAGLKFLRKPKEDQDSMEGDLLVLIRYRPKFLWFVIATLSQLFVYFIPKVAFGLFCAKELE